jgi:peptidoglycan/xylan/chitin deacetylase (PgdA/CDA1 family)
MKKTYVGIIILVVATLFALFLINNQSKPKTHQNILGSTQTKPSPIPTTPSPTFAQIKTYKIPVLMYHYIRVADPEDTLGVGLSVRPANFAKQMAWLNENNYETMKLEALADPEKNEISRIIGKDKKPIVLTFDDGYEDAYTEALPVLEKNKFIGTFFIVRDFVGRSEYMTQAQIDDMIEAGMEIGSHSLGHKNLATSPVEITKLQIFDSKLNATTFCYPSGKFNVDAVNLVKEAGYKVAVTTQPGIINQDSNLLELPRVRIKDISLEEFIKKVTE